MKRTVPLLITGFAGLTIIVVEFVPALREVKGNIEAYYQILLVFGAILGAASILRLHGSRMLKQQAGWGYSAVAVVGFIATLVVGLGKIGIPPAYGVYARFDGPDGQRGLALVTDNGRGIRTLDLEVQGLEPNTDFDLTIGGELFKTYNSGEFGVVAAIERMPRLDKPDSVSAAQAEEQRPSMNAGQIALGEIYIPPAIPEQLNEGQTAPQFATVPVAFGSMTGDFQRLWRMTGKYDTPGRPLAWLYDYIYQPLAQTMFAMLAYYVASAAFRAFRARNLESVLLLFTAFIILLGRTPNGVLITDFLPSDPSNPLSFFRLENITTWVMTYFNTAGMRAITIGIALGIAATSLKVLLGIDRSYIGQER